MWIYTNYQISSFSSISSIRSTKRHVFFTPCWHASISSFSSLYYYFCFIAEHLGNYKLKIRNFKLIILKNFVINFNLSLIIYNFFYPFNTLTFSKYLHKLWSSRRKLLPRKSYSKRPHYKRNFNFLFLD